MRNSKKKGTYGYRNYHKKIQSAIVGVLVLGILAQLGARFLVESAGTKNILTVMAILTVLPAANVASPLIASWKYKTISKSFYEACRPYEGQFPILYDLIITSKEQIIPVDAAVIHPTGVYLCCPSEKVDAKKAEKFLNDMLSVWKLDENARLLKEEKTFLKRLSSLKPVTEEEDDGSADYAIKLLKSLSM